MCFRKSGKKKDTCPRDRVVNNQQPGSPSGWLRVPCTFGWRGLLVSQGSMGLSPVTLKNHQACQKPSRQEPAWAQWLRASVIPPTPTPAQVQSNMVSCQLCFPKRQEATTRTTEGLRPEAQAEFGRPSDQWGWEMNWVGQLCILWSLQFLPTSFHSHFFFLWCYLVPFLSPPSLVGRN